MRQMMFPERRYGGDVRVGGVHEAVFVPGDIYLDVNGGFQTVFRVLSGDQIPLPPFILNVTPFTSVLPLLNSFFYLFLTSIQPLLRHESRATVWKPRSTDLGSHGISKVLR